MGRPPCCDESEVKKGPWTPEEDQKLMDYISKHGHGSWRTLPKHAGLNRCGKSCRLRWTNYLRPDIKRGKFTEEEEQMIINLHSVLGNKWSKIAGHLPGRTDNEIKNFWNTHIRKKLLSMGIDPETHKPRIDFNHLMNLTQLLGMSNLGNSMSTTPWGDPLGLQVDVTQLTKIQLLQNLLQIANMNPAYLLGNHSLNPLQALNTIHNNEPFLRGQEYANPGLFPQPHSESHHDISKSWTDVEGGSNLQGFGFNNSSSNIPHQTQSETALPALVSGFPAVNQMDTCCNTAQVSTESPSSPILEAWEKLLDDETIGSDWKEILDLTSVFCSGDQLMENTQDI